MSALSVNAGSVNVMVNDNNGDRRESFISIAPGEERFRKAEFFPNVILAEA